MLEGVAPVAIRVGGVVSGTAWVATTSVGLVLPDSRLAMLRIVSLEVVSAKLTGPPAPTRDVTSTLVHLPTRYGPDDPTAVEETVGALPYEIVDSCQVLSATP